MYNVEAEIPVFVAAEQIQEELLPMESAAYTDSHEYPPSVLNSWCSEQMIITKICIDFYTDLTVLEFD